ncbi:hypothetical protein CJF30_00001110 [Rutstroemia sp. NJR-2017a BBW]|nr:hypothetical protein CJF30_00001110 [Rutstroemia sp. NJR-2017a BBW]
MSPPKQRRFSAFPTIVEDAEDSPTPDSSLRRASSRTPFVEIWPRDNAPTEIVRGKLLEDKINSWIEQKDEFAYAKRESSKFGALRLLYVVRWDRAHPLARSNQSTAVLQTGHWTRTVKQG